MFHLLNGDLCYADLNPTVQPEVWRDFGNGKQTSKPLAGPGCHAWATTRWSSATARGVHLVSDPATRCPTATSPISARRWYSFRIGSVLFVSLDADDVVYQDAGAFVAGPAALAPVASTGNPFIEARRVVLPQGLLGRRANRRGWSRTLAAGRRDDSVDWIVVWMHQCACSSSATGNGSTSASPTSWLRCFDRCEVGHRCSTGDLLPRAILPGARPTRAADLVATCAVVNTLRPHPVTTHRQRRVRHGQAACLILGCGGVACRLDDYGTDTADGSPPGGSPPDPQVKGRCSRGPAAPVPTSTADVFTQAGPTRSGRRAGRPSATPRPATGSPCSMSIPAKDFGGHTSITVTQYHAVGADRSARPPASRARRPPATPSSRPSP